MLEETSKYVRHFQRCNHCSPVEILVAIIPKRMDSNHSDAGRLKLLACQKFRSTKTSFCSGQDILYTTEYNQNVTIFKDNILTMLRKEDG